MLKDIVAGSPFERSEHRWRLCRSSLRPCSRNNGIIIDHHEHDHGNDHDWPFALYNIYKIML